MAIVKCYECGAQVSTTAVACPRCGATPRGCPECKGTGVCRYCNGTQKLSNGGLCWPCRYLKGGCDRCNGKGLSF
jgi:hypothetical protein